MVALLRDRNRRVGMLTLAFIIALGFIAAYAGVSMSGTKTGAVLALLATIGPALLYAALAVPLVFPFGPYAALAPLDYILNFSQFGTITRLLGIATAAAMLFYMLRTRRIAQPHRNLAIWIVLFLWMSATLFWTMDLPMSSSMLATALQLFALYIVVSMFPIDLAQLRFARRMVIAGGVLAASYGIYLFHSGAGVRGDRLWISVDSGTLDPNHFAAALLLPIAFALSAFLWAPSRRVKIVALAGTFIMFMALTLSGSRGAMLGLIAIAIYLLIRDTHRVRLAIVMGCVGAVVIATSGASLISRFQIALSSGGAGRTDIWRIGAAAFKDHWLLGAGYGDFQFAYDSAFLRVFEPAYTNWHRAPHNTLLGAAVELGLIGAILLLCAWIGQFRMLAAIPSADERFPARIALEGALIGLFVSGMFADLMIEKYVWLAFMMVALTYNATTSQRDIHA